MQLVSPVNTCADVPNSSLAAPLSLSIQGCNYSNAQIFGLVQSTQSSLYFNSQGKCITHSNNSVTLGDCTTNAFTLAEGKIQTSDNKCLGFQNSTLAINF